MKVILERRLCRHVLTECDRCFGRFVLHPSRKYMPCITEYRGDGSPVLTVTFRYDNVEQTLAIRPEDREWLAETGWSNIVRVKPGFLSMRNEPENSLTEGSNAGLLDRAESSVKGDRK